jgi:hypothetical protein
MKEPTQELVWLIKKRECQNKFSYIIFQRNVTFIKDENKVVLDKGNGVFETYDIHHWSTTKQGAIYCVKQLQLRYIERSIKRLKMLQTVYVQVIKDPVVENIVIDVQTTANVNERGE